MAMNLKNKKIFKNKLFPYNGDVNIWSKVTIDDETVSFISTPYDADRITKIIENHCLNINMKPNDVIITDATAGAGGNVLSFAKKFKHVNAIEIDVKRFNFLVNNTTAYGLKNVSNYCDDCLQLIYSLAGQNIIFFDPPWGGKEYKNKTNIQLSLSDIPIENICIKLFATINPLIIALKLPKNYDLEFMYKKMSDENKKIKIFLYPLNKMNIIILENNLDHQFIPHIKQDVIITTQ